MKKIGISLLAMLLMVVSFTGCKVEPINKDGKQGAENEVMLGESGEVWTPRKDGELFLAVPTELEESGLLKEVLADFKKATNLNVTLFTGTLDEVFEMGEKGEVDVMIVNDTPRQDDFIASGHSEERSDVFRTDVVLVGPNGDPDPVKFSSNDAIIGGLLIIANEELPFYTTTDNTQLRELELEMWEDTGLGEPTGTWYHSSGKSEGDTLKDAETGQGYMLVNRRTFVENPSSNLQIVVENDDKLYDYYSVLAINETKNDYVQRDNGKVFVRWILSEEGQESIANFAKGEPPIYTPCAV